MNHFLIRKTSMVLTKSPDEHQKNLSDITKINTHSSSFDFLKDEPDLYTLADIKNNWGKVLSPLNLE